MTSTPAMSTSSCMSSILRQRLDRLQRLVASGSFPVLSKLGAIQLGPLGGQRSRSSGQLTDDRLAVDRHRCGPSRVAGMKVRPGMVALVPEHPDRDPVERADAW